MTTRRDESEQDDDLLDTELYDTIESLESELEEERLEWVMNLLWEQKPEDWADLLDAELEGLSYDEREEYGQLFDWAMEVMAETKEKLLGEKSQDTVLLEKTDDEIADSLETSTAGETEDISLQVEEDKQEFWIWEMQGGVHRYILWLDKWTTSKRWLLSVIKKREDVAWNFWDKRNQVTRSMAIRI
jgi:hypothetical protein